MTVDRAESSCERSPQEDSIFVAILGYGDLAPANALASSLLAGGWDPSDIAIVLNPSGSTEEAAPPVVRLHRLSHNVGYAGGMNAALSLMDSAGYQVGALLTHDCAISAASLRLLASHLLAHPRVAVAAPTLNWRDRPGVFSSGGILGARGPDHQQDALPPGTARKVEWADGAAVVVRPSALKSIGGFDERFFMYVEDVDLGLRLAAEDWDVVVLADAHATQDSGIPRRLPAYGYLHARNTAVTLVKARRWAQLLTFVASVVMKSAPRLWRSRAVRGLRDAAVGRLGPPPDDLIVGTDISL